MKLARLWPLFVIAGLVLAGPALAPYDPSAAIDPAALRLLPPGARAPALVGRDGSLRPVVGEDAAHPGRRVFDWRLEAPSSSTRRDSASSGRPSRTSGPAPKEHPGRHALVSRGNRPVRPRSPLAPARGRANFPARRRRRSAHRGAAGALAGLFAGATGGLVDLVVGRAGDALLALPRILLVAALAALFPARACRLALLLGATGWPAFARLVRADVVALARSELAAAARAVGCGPVRLALRHLAPHTLATLLAAAGLRVGAFVLLEASLSFLGFGVAPPAPSWGNILADGREVFQYGGWWVVAWPGLLLAGTVVILNKLAEDLRRLAGVEGPA